jgi:hypothetical protein
MGAEPTHESLSGEFPSWEVFPGVTDLVYARLRGSSPPVVVRGEDWRDLRDEMVRAVSKIKQGIYWAELVEREAHERPLLNPLA